MEVGGRTPGEDTTGLKAPLGLAVTTTLDGQRRVSVYELNCLVCTTWLAVLSLLVSALWSLPAASTSGGTDYSQLKDSVSKVTSRVGVCLCVCMYCV